jgi:hypothetical protein
MYYLGLGFYLTQYWIKDWIKERCNRRRVHCKTIGSISSWVDENIQEDDSIFPDLNVWKKCAKKMVLNGVDWDENFIENWEVEHV